MRAALGGASNNGPAPHQRAKCRSGVVGEAFDRGGARIDQVQLNGPNPYDLTGGLLAWAARMLAFDSRMAG